MKEILKQLARKEELGQPEINEVIAGLRRIVFSSAKCRLFNGPVNERADSGVKSLLSHALCSRFVFLSGRGLTES